MRTSWVCLAPLVSLAQSVAVSAGPREVLSGDWGVMGKGIEAVSYCIGVQVRSAVP